MHKVKESRAVTFSTVWLSLQSRERDRNLGNIQSSSKA